jgi:4-alpha-glucanotransferase
VKPPTLRDRTSGVLLHPTSLPGPHGSGDIGAHARAFVDFLARTHQSFWQMLPIGPSGYGDSPYSAQSAFAGNPLLIDLDVLGIDLDREALHDDFVDYERVTRFRERHLRRAWEALRANPSPAYRLFIDREARWLDDFALFDALKRAHGGVEWTKWERGVRLREPEALARARHAHAADIELSKFTQWLFDEQWRALRAYANERGVGLIGDIPIFVAHDSADVWQNQGLFKLDEEGMPTHVAGVPPDYFSATGQRWGNPLYRWNLLRARGFDWWVDRFRAALARFDAIRLDHFIGFVRYWQIPADEPTAMKGKWMKGPGRELFDAVAKGVKTLDGSLPLIAEDLGAVTPRVSNLRKRLRLPGIRLIQFAFGTDPQAPSFLPHNHDKSAVVYTGTHDNDTIVGWFNDRGGSGETRTPAQADAERHAALAYVGKSASGAVVDEIHWDMIRLAMASVARTAIVPLQDILGLGSEARMNRPGKADGNWRFRMQDGALTAEIEERLRRLTSTYGRRRSDAE